VGVETNKDIFTKIVELDTSAESICEEARTEAEHIHHETAAYLATEEETLSGLIQEKKEQIDHEASERFEKEKARLTSEHAELMDVTRNIGQDKIERTVRVIVSLLRGTV